jgi:hypothetical protein
MEQKPYEGTARRLPDVETESYRWCFMTSESVASKQRGEEQFFRLPLPTVVFRASLVYPVSGNYGGRAFLRALAAVDLPVGAHGSLMLSAQDVNGRTRHLWGDWQ